MRPRAQAQKELEENGYLFKRHGGNHDIYFNKELQCSIPLKRHDFDEDDLRYIYDEIRRNRRGRS